MLVLKIIGKLILLPVWLMLFVVWISIHIVISLYNIFQGFGLLLAGGMMLLALCFKMWNNAVFALGLIVVSFLIVVVGTVIETMIEELFKSVGKCIIS